MARRIRAEGVWISLGLVCGFGDDGKPVLTALPFDED